LTLTVLFSTTSVFDHFFFAIENKEVMPQGIHRKGVRAGFWAKFYCFDNIVVSKITTPVKGSVTHPSRVGQPLKDNRRSPFDCDRLRDLRSGQGFGSSLRDSLRMTEVS
jgi:hypothetical protein